MDVGPSGFRLQGRDLNSFKKSMSHCEEGGFRLRDWTTNVPWAVPMIFSLEVMRVPR